MKVFRSSCKVNVMKVCRSSCKVIVMKVCRSSCKVIVMKVCSSSCKFIVMMVCRSSCKVSTSFVRLQRKSAYVDAFSENPNMKFHENTSGESRAFLYRPTRNENFTWTTVSFWQQCNGSASKVNVEGIKQTCVYNVYKKIQSSLLHTRIIQHTHRKQCFVTSP
jgi:hypothetical protein